MKTRFAVLGLLALAFAPLMGCRSDPGSVGAATGPLSGDAQAAVDVRHRLEASEAAYQQASKDLADSMRLIQEEGPNTAPNVREANLNTMKNALEAVRSTLSQSSQITSPQLSNKAAEKALAASVRAHQRWTQASRQKIDRFFGNNNGSSDSAVRKSESASRDEVTALASAYRILNIPMGG